MRLDDLCEAVGDVTAIEEKLIHCEQHVNDFRGGWERFSDIDYRYSPEYGVPFQLEATLRGLGEVSVVNAIPTDQLSDAVHDGRSIRFYHHPDSPLDNEQPCEHDSVEVTATSSTRTVLTRGLPYNFFIKMSLPKRHFLYDRSVRAHVTEHSIKVSRDLEEASQEKGWAFLPETIGVVDGTTGLVFREVAPRPISEKLAMLIPGFALYSKDYSEPDDSSILTQLVKQYAPEKPLDFLVDRVIGPLQDCWANVLRERGLLLEMHAQNVLFELGDEGLGRVVVRDFQSIFSDSAIRDARKLPQMDIDTFEPNQRTKQYSLCYDHFLGHRFIKHLVNNFVKQYPDYDESLISRIIAYRFRRLHGDLSDEMPNGTTWRLARGPEKINGQPLIETGTPPNYR